MFEYVLCVYIYIDRERDVYIYIYRERERDDWTAPLRCQAGEIPIEAARRSSRGRARKRTGEGRFTKSKMQQLSSCLASLQWYGLVQSAHASGYCNIRVQAASFEGSIAVWRGGQAGNQAAGKPGVMNAITIVSCFKCLLTNDHY